MSYFDYRTYFQTMIDNQELIISSNDNILKFLCFFTFIFCCFFMYFLIRNMIRNK